MSNDTLLELVKLDLQLLTNAFDALVLQDIDAAKEYIAREGITLGDTAGDAQLVVMYAAYLYRQRVNPDNKMPRMLRWELNKRLFAQKAGG